MRGTSRWIITGLALSVSVGAQAAVLSPPVTMAAHKTQESLKYLRTQYLPSYEGAREREAELGLTYSQRRQVQADLRVLGFNPGPVDGSFGRVTRQAIWNWQQSMDYWASGYLTRDQVRQLRAAASQEDPRRYSEAEDRRFWEESGAAWGSQEGMRRYLERYPEGIYAAYARDRLGMGDRDERRRDEAAWREARANNTIRAYRDYLDRYPDGRYAEEARHRVRELRADREEEDWHIARRQDTIEGYRTFLRRYPESRLASEARRRIEELRRVDETAVEEERRVWRDAKQENTISAYQNYLRLYPRGRFVTEAKAKIRALRDRQPDLTPEELKAQEKSILRTPKDVANLIEGLRRLGYLKSQTEVGMTPVVRDAIRRLQRKIGKPQTGYVDPHVWSVVATVGVTR